MIRSILNMCFYFLTAIVCLTLFTVVQDDTAKVISISAVLFGMDIVKEDFFNTDNKNTH
jgi:hypothetical protein